MRVQREELWLVVENGPLGRKSEAQGGRMFDVLIKGGWVLDLTGSPAFRANVALEVTGCGR